MAIQKFRWIFLFAVISAIVVFISSIMVNSILTSFFRAGIALVMGLFVGLFFYTLWSFIAIDFKPHQNSKKEEGKEILKETTNDLDNSTESY